MSTCYSCNIYLLLMKVNGWPAKVEVSWPRSIFWWTQIFISYLNNTSKLGRVIFDLFHMKEKWEFSLYFLAVEHHLFPSLLELNKKISVWIRWNFHFVHQLNASSCLLLCAKSLMMWTWNELVQVFSPKRTAADSSCLGRGVTQVSGGQTSQG